MLITQIKKYRELLKQIRKERGEFCEACHAPAKYGHHIIPVSELRVHANLIFEPANIIILCNDCHSLMHPLLRNVSDWKKARIDRGQMLNRLS